MSLTVQQILSDAKRLVSRLREDDGKADQVIARAQALQHHVDAVQQYHEEIVELNTVAGQRPRSTLILGIQQENLHLRALQQENQELRNLLDEHQSAIEMIMTKYRQHIVKLLQASKAEQTCAPLENSKLLQERADKICEMAAVMARAVALDDEGLAKEEERFRQLSVENRGLRELLEISNKAGSLRHPLLLPETVDRHCQTETS